jgi:hypothetical protein
MLLKSSEHLHPLLKVKSDFVNKNDENCNLDFFEMTTNTDERARKLQKRIIDISLISTRCEGY